MGKIKKTNKISLLLFVCVLIFSGIIILFYSYNIYSWRNYPDFGFGYRVATGFNNISTVTPHGKRGGMQVGDRILKINGKDFSDFQEFIAAMNRELGEKNTYQMKRGENILNITILNVPIGLKRALSISGLSFLVGLCYLLIGTLVFLMKPHHRTSWVFFIFTTVLVFSSFLFIVQAG